MCVCKCLQIVFGVKIYINIFKNNSYTKNGGRLKNNFVTHHILLFGGFSSFGWVWRWGCVCVWRGCHKYEMVLSLTNKTICIRPNGLCVVNVWSVFGASFGQLGQAHWTHIGRLWRGDRSERGVHRSPQSGGRLTTRAILRGGRSRGNSIKLRFRHQFVRLVAVMMVMGERFMWWSRLPEPRMS